MGTIWMPTSHFASFFSERVGYKSGLALTREELVEHTGDIKGIVAALVAETDAPVRLHASEIEDAFQIVLHKLGRIETSFLGHGPTLLYVKYMKDPQKLFLFERVMSLLGAFHFDKGKLALNDGFDRPMFLKFIQREIPPEGIAIAVELIDLIKLSEEASPWEWLSERQFDWVRPIELKKLFVSEELDAMHGIFFDQRFVDYLSANFAKTSSMHWRQFEALAAEFFVREGFEVEIGPGRNDGGVDIRVWDSGSRSDSPPAILVQCKRQKAGVEKVVIKALWADVVHEGATSGLIVTSSTLSPGAEAVRTSRSYPVHVADRATLRGWIEQMRTPGRGVFLSA